MNQTTFRPHGLIWKETRLVVPLILMLVGAAVLLVTLWSLFQRSALVMEYATQIIPVMLPILYAAGAGAILIGQERENRTLWWFVSLPISPQRVFWTKTTVALVGLVLMIGMGAAFAWVSGRMQESELGTLTILLCVYITLSGIYTSWRIKNTFASLIAVLPLAIMPVVVPSALTELSRWVSRSPRLQTNAFAFSIGVGIVIVLWLAYRAAMRTLLPADSRPEFRHNSDAWREPWQSTIPVTPSFVPPAQVTRSSAFRSSLNSLVWQSVHHNVLTLIGLIALAILGFSLLLFGSIRIAPLSMVAWVSGWLGVFAFTGDGSAKRLRFLADRGVSPTKVWLGRHAVNVSLVSLAVLVYGAISILLIVNRSSVVLWPSIGMAALVLWTVYGVSQWTSQLIRILPAAVLLGPVIAAVVVYWLGFAATELDAPLWLILLCTCLPMLATWVSMRRFMDEVGQLRIWLVSLAPAIALFVLPMVPAARTVMTWPSMPASTRTALLAEANLAVRDVTHPQSMMLKESPIRAAQTQSGNALFSAMSDKEALAILEESSFAPEARLQLGDGLHDSSVPLAVDLSILENSLAITSYHLLQFKSDPSNEDAIERLGAWVKTLTTMTQRFRASPRWLDQEAADVVEIWLTQNLSSDAMKSLAARDFVMEAREMLADREARSKSRRRAVLASWREYDAKSTGYLGGLHSYEWTPALSATMRKYVVDRNVDAIVDRAIRLIEAGDRGESTLELRRELHDLTTDPAIAFEDGPYADRLRASKKNGMTISSRQTLMFPANQWYAGWEDDAAK